MQRLGVEEHNLLTRSVLKTLAQNRITTILEFLQEDAEKLTTLMKLSLPEVIAIRNSILNKYAAPLINVGSLKIDSLKNNKCLNTDIINLDAATGGGLPIGYITEVCGLADAGKSRLCLQLTINCVKNSDNVALYIDTKGDFSAVKLQKMLDACGYSHKDMALMMFKIKILNIWSMEDLTEFFKKLHNGTVHLEKLRLIILDSLPCLMFQFLGDDNKIGLKFLNTFVNYARFTCKQQNISLVCVNIQTRWMDQENADLEDDGGSSIYTRECINTEKRNRCLGKYWQHIPMMLLIVEKQQERRSKEECSDTFLNITVINNQTLVKNSCSVTLTNLGVT